MLRCVICTALGDPVEPDVSCISARSSSPVSIGSIGSAASRSVDGQDLDALLLEHRDRDQERLGDDDGLGLDHVDDVHGVLGPDHQVGARGGLVQHRQAGAAHPQALRGRRDLDREAGQHADRVAVTDAGGGQAAGDAAGPLVHLAPGVPDGFVRFTGDHARGRVAGIAVHLLGESAHDNLLGSPANATCPMLRLVDGAFT